MKQISLYDIVNDKDKKAMTPEVWVCMETCANFTNVEPDGSLDFFPETNDPRCTQTDFTSKLINNYWHTTCKNYKPREEGKNEGI